MSSSTTPRLLSYLTAAVLVAGVLCQFIQKTDPVFPLWYFTVDSAILAAVVSLWSAHRPNDQAAIFLRGLATTAVVLSAIVYAAVIAPMSPTGTWFQPWDDLWVRAALVLMHGIAPFLVVAQFLTYAAPRTGLSRVAATWCLWPALYVVCMLTAAAFTTARIPYAFLDPEEMGGLLPVLGSGLVVGCVFFLLGRGALALHARVGRKDAS